MSAGVKSLHAFTAREMHFMRAAEDPSLQSVNSRQVLFGGSGDSRALGKDADGLTVHMHVTHVELQSLK